MSTLRGSVKYIFYSGCTDFLKISSSVVTVNYTYPKDLFKTSNFKPKVDIPRVKLTDAREKIHVMIMASKFEFDVVCQYLWALATKVFSPTLKEDWKSFQTVIGVKGSKITVSDLISNESSTPTLVDPSEVIERVDGYYLLLALFGIRLGRASASNDDYANILLTNFQKVAAHFQEPEGEITIKLMEPNMKAACGIMPYTALCAAFDMFLCKFKHHQFYRCRFGSMGTRWKDCGGLPLIELISRTESFDFITVFQWVWNKSQQQDFSQLFLVGNELDKEDSYAPYCSDMGLMLKSPYALSSTPNLSMFYLALLCMLGKSRGVNAYCIDEAEWEKIKQNLIPLVWALTHN